MKLCDVRATWGYCSYEAAPRGGLGSQDPVPVGLRIP
jgi:hypothetical protein